MKLLIIEDERSLNQGMADFFTSAGYLCESVYNYKDALNKMEDYSYDCIILDLMLPGGSGLSLLKYLKQDRKEDGVIIISAKGSVEDRVEGIELGADDYLTKPFHFSELSARVAAILRRRNFQGRSVIAAGDMEIDTNGKTVSVNNLPIELTQKEYQLLLFFVINKNRVLSKNAIAQHLWGDDMDLPDSYDFIYSHIKNLRKKLTAAGCSDYIRSMYGEGYKMQLT